MRAKREQSALVDRQRRAVKFASIQPPASVQAALVGSAPSLRAPLQPARVRALPMDLQQSKGRGVILVVKVQMR